MRGHVAKQKKPNVCVEVERQWERKPSLEAPVWQRRGAQRASDWLLGPANEDNMLEWKTSEKGKGGGGGGGGKRSSFVCKKEYQSAEFPLAELREDTHASSPGAQRERHRQGGSPPPSPQAGAHVATAGSPRWEQRRCPSTDV